MDWENPKDVLRALVLLYSLQTSDERKDRTTVHENGVGFTYGDADFLTSVAEQVMVRKSGISSKQFSLIQKKLRKYHRQIDEFGIGHIELPPTAIVYESTRDKKEYDGLLYIDNGALYFKPEIFPTTIVKSLGFRWNNGKWEGELNVGNIYKLQDIFKNCKIDPSVEQWLEDQENPTVWEDEDLGRDLFAFQKQAVGFMLDKQRCMLALAPGLGKTACAIHAAKAAGGTTLIIAPLSLVRNWRKEIAKWVGDESEIWHGNTGSPSEWVITNYETALFYMVTYDEKVSKNNKGKKITKKVNWRLTGDFEFDNVIIDETILVKNRKAQRTQAVKTLAKTPKNVWMLSGSPVSKFFDDMWSQLNILDASRFSSYWRFAKEYAVVEQNRWGWQITANQPDADARIKRDLQDIYFARTQKQVLDIPDWVFEEFDIEMGDEQYRLYKEMEATFLAKLPDGDVVLAPNVLTQLLRLIQFASNPILVGGPDRGAKWKSIPEILEFTTLPTIIWTNFILTAQLMQEKLESKYRVATLTGDTASDLRQNSVDRFQQGEVDILIAHPAVGKFGHTLTAAKTAIYLERSYNGDDYYQSLHRIKRISTTESPHVIHLLAARPNSDEPTVDHVIHKILKYRKDNSISITSGIVREYFQE